MNQEESEHSEVDGMKKEVDFTGEVIHIMRQNTKRELRHTQL